VKLDAKTILLGSGWVAALVLAGVLGIVVGQSHREVAQVERQLHDATERNRDVIRRIVEAEATTRELEAELAEERRTRGELEQTTGRLESGLERIANLATSGAEIIDELIALLEDHGD